MRPEKLSVAEVRLRISATQAKLRLSAAQVKLRLSAAQVKLRLSAAKVKLPAAAVGMLVLLHNLSPKSGCATNAAIADSGRLRH